MANWTNEPQPFGANRAPLLAGLSSVDGITPVPVAVVPSTGALVTSGGGGGSGTTIITDGSNTAIKATVAQLTNSNPQAVEIVDGSGNQITSFGGGTQYTQGGATVANPTGTAEIWFDGSGNPKSVTPSQPLPSNITDGTNAANVVAGDTGFNGVATTSGTKTYTFTTSTSGAQIIGPYFCEGFASVEVVYTSVGSGLTLTGQFSPTSGGTYVTSTNWTNINNASAAGITNAANIIGFAPIRGNYFQLNVSALTSGTFAGTITFKNTSVAYSAVEQGGTWSVNSLGSTNNTGGTITTSSSVITGSNKAGYGGYAEISIHGTYSGVQFGISVSDDTGITFYNPDIYDGTARTWIAGASTITPGTNASKLYWVPFLPTSEIKVTASAYSTGTATVNINYGSNSLPGSTMSQIMDSAGNARGANVDANSNLNTRDYASSATGATAPSNAIQIGGSDGTNLQSVGVVAGDSGFSGLAVGSATKTISFTTSATGVQTLLPATSVEGYSYVTIITTSIGSGLAWTAPFSPSSGGTYTSFAGWVAGNSGTSTSLGIISNQAYTSHVFGNFFQIAISAMTGGTTSGNIILSNAPVGFSSMTVGAVQSGTWTIAGTQGAVADNTNSTQISNANQVFNGATFDRMRNNILVVAQASGTTATSSNTVTTYNARYATITINVSAYTSGTMNIAINLLTSSGYSYSPFTSIAGLAATGTVVYRIGPGLTPVTGLTANDVLGRSLQIVTSGTFSLTYGIDVNLSV